MPSHPNPESDRYKGPIKWLQYVLARGLITLLQRLPIGLAYKLGRGTGWLSWKIMSKRRAVVRKNLEVVNAWMEAQSANNEWRINDGGEEQGMAIVDSAMSSAECNSPSTIRHYSSLPLEAQTKEVFQRAGANLFSGFTFNRMSPEQVEHHIQVEGLGHLETALAAGKGAIILLAHMGPWEALTQLPGFAARHGIEAPFGAMYRPLNNSYLDDWFKCQREASGTRLFSRRDGFHKPVDFIRNGGMLGILADQKMREGPSAKYFGVDTATSPIPGLFHRRSKAPMLALSVVSVAPLRWVLTLAPVAFPEGLDLGNREALASICNQALEQCLACSPCDGFWLHKRF